MLAIFNPSTYILDSGNELVGFDIISGDSHDENHGFVTRDEMLEWVERYHMRGYEIVIHSKHTFSPFE